MSDDINRWIDLAEISDKNHNYPELLRASGEIIRLAPHAPQAFFLKAMALQHMDRLDEACDSYRECLMYNPHYVDAWVNLGICCQALGLNDEAEEAARMAIREAGQEIDEQLLPRTADHDLGRHHWNLAILELLKGDYRNGFPRYASRYAALVRKRPDFPQPLWRGEDLEDKTIIVTAEQGHGDTLMMARFLPVLKQRGAKVLLRAQPALIPYLKNWDGVDGVFGHSDPLPAFDVHASEFDLPRLLGVEYSSVPAPPYLPVPQPVEKLPDTGRRKIAVTWAGFAGHGDDRNRSVPLAALEPLFKNPAIDFYALNRDKREGDEILLKKWGVTDLSPQLNDFNDTASFITQMDLTISCDTSVAHLAGAMGRPLWVMLPFAPSWAWGTRETTPWYPKTRLFRQEKRGDWSTVAKIIAESL